MVHLQRRRQHDLGGEGERADGGGWGDGAIVHDASDPHPARRICEKGRLLPAVRLAGGPRAVRGTQAPHVLAVSLPLLRIRDGVAALRVSRPAAVLKVVESMLAHVRVLDAAEIHPYVRELVAEEGREAQESLVVERTPELVVGAGPARPGLLPHAPGRRAGR